MHGRDGNESDDDWSDARDQTATKNADYGRNKSQDYESSAHRSGDEESAKRSENEAHHDLQVEAASHLDDNRATGTEVTRDKLVSSCGADVPEKLSDYVKQHKRVKANERTASRAVHIQKAVAKVQV